MKTSRHYFYMAALLLAATFTSCSSGSDDITTEPVAPQPGQPASSGTEVTLTGTLNGKGNDTRSVDESGTTAWQVGEKIAVYYQKTDNSYATAEAEIKSVDSDTHSATYKAMLNDPKTGTTVQLVYPATMHDGAGGYSTDGLLNNQKGTISDISTNWDLATGSGSMTVSGSRATLPSLTLENQPCIVHYTITGTAGGVRFEISDGTNNYNIVNSNLGTTIYVAMLPVNNGSFKFTYHISTPGFIYTLKTDAKLDDPTTLAVGDLIDFDGKVYTADFSWNTDKKFTKEVSSATLKKEDFYNTTLLLSTVDETKAAMIAYLGTDTGEENYNYTHGLAIALYDAMDNNTELQQDLNVNPNDNKVEWATTNSTYSNSIYHSSYRMTNANNVTTAESGLQYRRDVESNHNDKLNPAFYAAFNYNKPQPEGCSEWFLPTAYQWNLMVNACKGKMGKFNYGDDYTILNNYWDFIEGPARGGKALGYNGHYWLSTEYDRDEAWAFNTQTGNFDKTNKTLKYYVRSILAF